jgi:hypothetical protein
MANKRSFLFIMISVIATYLSNLFNENEQEAAPKNSETELIDKDDKE